MRRKTLATLLVALLCMLSLCVTGCGNQGKKNLELAKNNQVEYLKTVQQNTMKKAVESSKLLSVLEKVSEKGSFVAENADEDIKIAFYTDKGKFALDAQEKDESIKLWYDNENLCFDLTNFADIEANLQGVYKIVLDTFLQSVKDSVQDDPEAMEYIEKLLEWLKKGTETSKDNDKIMEKILNCFDVGVNEEKVDIGGEETDCIVCTYTFKDTTLHDLVKVAYENIDLSKIKDIYPDNDYPQGDDIWNDTDLLSDDEYEDWGDWDYPEQPSFAFPETADDMIALLDEMNVSVLGSMTSYVIKDSCVYAKEIISLDIKFENEMYGPGFYMDIYESDNSPNLNSLKMNVVVNYPKNMSFTESASVEVKVDYNGVSMTMGANWNTKTEDNKFVGEFSLNVPKLIMPATPKFVVTYDINTEDYSALIITPNVTLTIPEEENLDVKIMGKLNIGEKYVEFTVDKIAEMDGDFECSSNDFNIKFRADVGTDMPDMPKDAKEIKTYEELETIFAGLD